MRWSELSHDHAIWTVPGTRMKRGQAHVVALPDLARDALRAVTRIKSQDLVFSTTGKTHVSGFTKAKAALTRQRRSLTGGCMIFAGRCVSPGGHGL